MGVHSIQIVRLNTCLDASVVIAHVSIASRFDLEGGSALMGSEPQWRNHLSLRLGCTGRFRELILEHQSLLTIAPGTHVFLEGSKPEAAYLLLQGTLEILAALRHQAEKLDQIEPGMICDIAACILNIPHNYTARAASDCDLVRLPIAIWQEVMKEPSVALHAANQLSDDLKQMLRQIASR
jgi:CRP-like cAMP-binding protein